MKQLVAGIVLIFIIGVIAFAYRNILERPVALTPATGAPNGTACTQEAKVCPDGTSVGRTGPSCAFAPCLPPNVESSELGIAFALPAGYVANGDAIGAEPTLSAVFDKPSKGSVPNSIFIYRYPIPAGKTANDVLIANTTYETSGLPAKSLKEFAPVVINGKTFYSVTLERFEGQVHTAYYLPRSSDVLRFDILEKDVTNWSDPKLSIDTLPEHTALLGMLGTLQVQTP